MGLDKCLPKIYVCIHKFPFCWYYLVEREPRIYLLVMVSKAKMIYVAIAPTMSISENVQDDAVKVIHDIYSSIGFKPPSKQFTILASFYLTRQINCSKTNFKLISLTTGTKCTPAAKYSPRGELLHDTHAEVLARRGAVRWLMEEIKRMNTADLAHISDWLTVTESGILSDSDDNPPYCLRPGVSLHMYVSTLPCRSVSYFAGLTQFI